MELKPVEQYHEPKLPTRRIIDECPQLLEIVPRRWQTNPVVLSALAGVCTLMLGSRIFADNQPANASKVAPIFEHGEGYGSFGCIATNPPVFLSEDEARLLIVEEAKRQKVNFSLPGPELSDVLMPTYKWADRDVIKTKQPLALDGQDTKQKIFFEFVSTDDLQKWEKPSGWSVYTNDALKAAKGLSAQLQKTKSEGVYAVFYDPLVMLDMDKAKRDEKGRLDWKAWLEMRDTQGKQMAKDELRKQVQDFIKWLKSQGVI